MNLKWTTSELKESLLIGSAIVWAAILLLPGNVFATTSAIGFIFQYAPDHVWGAIIIAVCLPIFFVNRHRFPGYRSFIHAFLWTIWSGIVFLIIYRSATGENGFQLTSFLISIPFADLAFMHAILYAGLGRRPDDQP